MKDVGEPLCRRQRLEHDEQREADGVGEQRLVLGVDPVGGVDDRVGNVHVERLLASRPARAEHVQRDACDDGSQPGAEVLDLACVGAAEPQPSVLDGVVSFAERAEHPIGDRAQMRSCSSNLWTSHSC